jgi:hypothetical protein
MPSELAERLKTSLDELRMQVLGAQVLLGFQFQSLFQVGFQGADASVRLAAAIGLVAICASLAGLIAPAAQHRLVEHGDASSRILRLANRCAAVSLGLLALALGSDVYGAARLQGSSQALGFACAMVVVSVGMWFGVGTAWRKRKLKRGKDMVREEVDAHTKIEQMLTESRVILPGAQAMLGFQLIVVMTEAFNQLPAPARYAHFAALGAVILSVVLLITPAAVHRLSFAGSDDLRFHRIGSWLVTIALVPLAGGISLDFAVAALRLSANPGEALGAGMLSFAVLISLWYVWPMALKVARPGRKSK